MKRTLITAVLGLFVSITSFAYGSAPGFTVVETHSQFVREVMHSSVPTIVEFTMEHCGVCAAEGDELRKLAEDAGQNVKIVLVPNDSDAYAEYRDGRWASFPEIHLYMSQGSAKPKLDRPWVGYMPREQLEHWIRYWAERVPN